MVQVKFGLECYLNKNLGAPEFQELDYYYYYFEGDDLYYSNLNLCSFRIFSYHTKFTSRFCFVVLSNVHYVLRKSTENER